MSILVDLIAAGTYTGRDSSEVYAMRRFTAIIEREDDGYVSFCPELDIASQGATVELSRANLREAIELFLETASEDEVRRRLSGEVYVTAIEVAGA